MNREKKQFLIWLTIAGILFMIVGIHDLFFVTAINKSTFMIVLEIVAGLCFLLNVLIQWRRFSQRSD